MVSCVFVVYLVLDLQIRLPLQAEETSCNLINKVKRIDDGGICFPSPSGLMARLPGFSCRTMHQELCKSIAGM